MRDGEEAHPARGGPDRLRPHQLGAGLRAAGQHHHPAGAVRRGSQGRHRARLLRQVQRGAPVLPRAADGEHRRGVQHHRGQHAHGRPARAVAVAHQGAAEPAGRAENDQRPPRAAGGQPAAFGKPAEEAAGRVAQHQRGTAGQSEAAVRSDAAGRVQEPGSRAGEVGAGGEGRAAGPQFALQVGVPRQHVA